MPRSLLPHTLRTTTLAPCGCSLPCAVGKNGLTATWVHDCFPFSCSCSLPFGVVCREAVEQTDVTRECCIG